MNVNPAVHVVDDDAQARRAVMTLIEAMAVETVGHASAEDFLSSYDGRRPCCLVTDVRMLGMSGLDLQEELIRRNWKMSVIVLTAFATTPGTVRAMRNGAVSLLEKPCRDDELWEAVRQGLAADRVALAEEQKLGEVRQRWESLSAKERLVLACITAGDANKIVAKKLNVSVRTVELHRHSVFEKMGAESLAELVRMMGPLEVEPPPGMPACP